VEDIEKEIKNKDVPDKLRKFLNVNRCEDFHVTSTQLHVGLLYAVEEKSRACVEVVQI